MKTNNIKKRSKEMLASGYLRLLKEIGFNENDKTVITSLLVPAKENLTSEKPNGTLRIELL